MNKSQISALKSILETQYTDGITAIKSAELNDKGDIVGIFEDKISPIVTKRYAFRVADDSVAYKLINRDALDYLEAEEELNFGDTEDKDPADLYAEQAIAAAAPIFDNWLSQIETSLFDGAESLEQIRDRVESVYSDLDAADFSELMSQVLMSGYLSGRYQVLTETKEENE